MALLSFPQEMGRSLPEPPFANGFEGESWMRLWCEDCANDVGRDCPLVAVALMGRTPLAWDDENPGHLNRYVCHEFVKKEEQ